MSDFAIRMLFALGFLIAGVGVLYYIYRVRSLAKASRQWPFASGTITRSGISSNRGKGGMIHTAQVQYTYQVSGTDHRGSRIAWQTPASKKIEEAEAALKPFPEGKRANVYYDPQKPSRSVLVHGDIGTFETVILYILGIGFTAFGVLMAAVAIHMG